jgi:hypothetical protein
VLRCLFAKGKGRPGCDSSITCARQQLKTCGGKCTESAFLCQGCVCRRGRDISPPRSKERVRDRAVYIANTCIRKHFPIDRAGSRVVCIAGARTGVDIAGRGKGGEHMLNALARVILFFSSYAPLALIFIVLYIGKSSVVFAIAAAALVVGVAGLLWIVYRAHKDIEPISGIVADYRKRGDEVMGYVATYLIPLVGFSLTDVRQGIAFVVFVVVLAYLYTSTDLIHINPTLHLFGYSVYEVTFQNSGVKRIITRRILRRQDELQLIPLGDNLWIDKGE